MASHSATVLIHLFLILCTSSAVLCEIGCPPQEDVEPCTCSDHPSTRLVCSGITDVAAIETVLTNSERYTYQEMHLINSTISFLPTAAFDKVNIKELYIKNSRLVSLLDKPPVSRSLYKLQLDNSVINRFYSIDILKNVTSLRILIVNGMEIPRIDSTLSKNFPSSLTQITFSGTKTKKIYEGAFEEFPRLDKLSISDSNLSEMTRDIFPWSFNVRFLYLYNDNITKIPDDFFIRMPNLQFLNLKDNFITTLPEAAFYDRDNNVPYVRLDGNPLNCNCLLVWLIKHKPEVIGGTCSMPRHLNGKHLEELRPADFNCETN